MKQADLSKYLASIGSKGGTARAKALTKKEQRAIALKASKAAARAGRAARKPEIGSLPHAHEETGDRRESRASEVQDENIAAHRRQARREAVRPRLGRDCRARRK